MLINYTNVRGASEYAITQEAINYNSMRIEILKGFRIDSYITVDIPEIEVKGDYKLYLRPEDSLVTGVNLNIEFPGEVTLVGAVCFSPQGDSCTLSPDHSFITIQNVLSAAYTETPGNFIEIDVINTFNNPNITYLFSDIGFKIKSYKDMRNYHSGKIFMKMNTSRYVGHPLANGSVSSSSNKTASATRLTFNMRNKDYIINSGYHIYIKLHSALTFILTPPTFIPIQGLNPDSSSSDDSTSHIHILNAFNTHIAPNTLIQFTIHNILTPYHLGQFNIMVGIRDQCVSERRNFVIDTLKIDITEIGEFPSFSVISSSYYTSEFPRITFTVEIGDGSLNYLGFVHQIKFKFPDDINPQLCDLSTLTGISGFSTPITNKYWDPVAELFVFDVPCLIPTRTIMSFSMKCWTPDTTRPTSNFRVIAVNNSAVFYESIGSPITMTNLSNFESLVLQMEENEALVNNIFTLNITRTADHKSQDINMLEITIPSEMVITSGVCVEIIYGITLISGSVPVVTSVSGEIIEISGIKTLDKILSIKLLNIQNPGLNITPIIFGVLSKHSEGYQGERGNTNTLNTLCDFPCKECAIMAPNQCTSCFPKDHPVFGGAIYQEYIYISALSACLSSCPPHYFLSSPTQCTICHTNCANCTKTQYICTSCQAGSFFYASRCIPNCPLHHYQNDIHWLCQCNIYIYIYI